MQMDPKEKRRECFQSCDSKMAREMGCCGPLYKAWVATVETRNPKHGRRRVVGGSKYQHSGWTFMNQRHWVKYPLHHSHHQHSILLLN